MPVQRILQLKGKSSKSIWSGGLMFGTTSLKFSFSPDFRNPQLHTKGEIVGIIYHGEISKKACESGNKKKMTHEKEVGVETLRKSIRNRSSPRRLTKSPFHSKLLLLRCLCKDLV
ncbi:hypothetical protein L2E82_24927 [Cichorium intybus]|uniref:Uncharacterized protein n=1 Tax=Cichorium intybus TaxID=13427 RepID=A0ACB9E293_CICIN|nr:hypothetical protein L2E82_24927 [Cichorium intybus]